MRGGRSKLVFHFVEALNKGELEAQCPFSGEAHGEEGEAVSGHVEGAVLAEAEADLYRDFNASKIGPNGRLGLNQGVNVAKDVLVFLPEKLCHVLGVGDDLARLVGDDGSGR